MVRELELETLRAIDFNWTLHLQSVWDDHAYHVDNLQPRIAKEFAERITKLKEREAAHSPLGWVLTGAGGAGKTHMLSWMRSEVTKKKCAFILVDMTDVHDFWETVAIGYTNSLQEAYTPELTQSQFILRQLISDISPPHKIDDNMHAIVHADSAKFQRCCLQILQTIARKHRRHRRMAAEYQDTVRALIASNCEDFEMSNLGQIWLQGVELEPADKQRLGLKKNSQSSQQTVAGLSWVISLSMPSVVAFDQLDPIVRQLEFEAIQSNTEDNAAQEAVANSIISGIGDGLRSMYDCTQRTLVILSCLERSWEILHQRSLQTSADRFSGQRPLQMLENAERVSAMLAARVRPACERTGYNPPFPTWPFHPDALAKISGTTPREFLKRCYAHQKECLERGKVTILQDFDATLSAVRTSENGDAFSKFDQQFTRLCAEAKVADLFSESGEDDQLAAAVVSACNCLIQESKFPDDIHAIVDSKFTGGSKVKPLHARLRLIYQSEGEREEHFSLRILQRKQATAFQNRLKGAMTQSGIDDQIAFRHLTILRTETLPTGVKTQELLERFTKNGGRICAISESEVRAMWALHRLSQLTEPDFDTWLRARQIVTQMAWCKQVFGGAFGKAGLDAKPQLGARQDRPESASQPRRTDPNVKVGAETASEPKVEPKVEPTAKQPAAAPPAAKEYVVSKGHPRDAGFPLGRRLIGTEHGEPLTMPLEMLDKHVVVRAGSGSGKTVLLKRLIEQAALRGVPSIVIDAGNDLAALGDRWPIAPDTRDADDVDLAERYHNQVETVIWTPGRMSANPLRLELIPDLRSLVNDQDDFDGAVAMVTESLADVLELGNKRNDRNKKAIISCALKFFVEQGMAGLESFIELLTESPVDAQVGISNESKLASEIADDLRVLVQNNPLVSEDKGAPLDPAILFGDDKPRDKTRISVISLAFLPSDVERLRFVNLLATTLFAWIKANPKPSGRNLRGLLVLDEAKDLIPARGNTPCKQSIMRLTAQARKYRLGVILATQNPREIENTVIGNCSTQFFGKANSTTAIETIKDVVAQLNGNARDIGRLPQGVFYAYNAEIGMREPMKIVSPMCLSHHRPLTADEVLRRATPNDKLPSSESREKVPSIH